MRVREEQFSASGYETSIQCNKKIRGRDAGSQESLKTMIRQKDGVTFFLFYLLHHMSFIALSSAP